MQDTRRCGRWGSGVTVHPLSTLSRACGLVITRIDPTKQQVSDCEYEEKISRKLFLDFSPDRWDLILRTGRQAERGPRPRSPPDRLASDDAAWRLDEALESYASRRAGSDKKKPVGLFGD
jgi:hypothetical protein